MYAYESPLYRVDFSDVDVLMKKSWFTQTRSKSESYIVSLKAGKEQVKVEVEFNADGMPDVTSISSKGSFEVIFDVVCLHR